MDLAGELIGGTDVGRALLLVLAPPLRDQQADERLSRPGGQLQSYVAATDVVFRVGPQRIGLLGPEVVQAGVDDLEAPEQLFRGLRGLGLSCG